eukprot:CAMPEP_0172675038 /NCGR_PEP_ID=MMETSP1074-20121228/13056_1 /TAXON_ID=2916 /ORGANISM="Ceratium fusus, Strain PA161109" /LENGTH=598 /DNA_ID=CAMNT_0013492485 /DNA_START=42 /DNA_END=1838 /DNA_ORIENTATION=+
MSSVPFCCLVPQEAVSSVSTKRISKDSGADVHIIGENDTPQTLIDRILTIQGSPDQKEVACRDVVKITHGAQDVRENEEGIFVLVVPASATSFIIGLNGTTISGIIEATGTDVSISRHTITGTRLQPISISGMLVATVAAAGRINALLQQLADQGSLDWDAWPPFHRGRATARSARTSRDSPPRSRTTSMHGVVAPGGFSGAATATTAASTAASTRNSSRSATPARAAGSSRSGYAGSSSSSPAPTARGGEASGEGRSISGGRSVGGGSASSRSTSRVRADLPISTRGDGGHNVQFVVSAQVAAWIVGKGGRSLVELQEASGAFVDIPRSDGPTRFVIIAGPPEAVVAAIHLLLDLVSGYPGAAMQETQIFVPAGAATTFLTTRRELWKLREDSGAGVDMVEQGDGSITLILSGPRTSITHAAELIAGSLAVTSGELPQQKPLHRTRPRPSAERSWMSSTSSGNARDLASAAAFACVDASRPLPVVAPATTSIAGDSAPNEAALLKLLLAGPDPNRAQLQVALPSGFVQGVLKKHMHAFETRSGSTLELGPEHPGSGAEPATQLLTTTGSMLGNSMAILYIQELMIQHSNEFDLLSKP